MIGKLKIIVGVILIFTCSLSCKQENKEDNTTKENKTKSNGKVLKILKADKKNSLTINQHEFYSVIIGSDFEEVPKGILQVGQLQKDKVPIEVNYIVAENGVILGHVLPDPEDKNIVGSIVITSKQAKTSEGLGIGSTFEDILKFHPKIEVYGTELEGSTYAKSGNIIYKLNVKKYKLNVDASKIKPTTAIVKIILKNEN